MTLANWNVDSILGVLDNCCDAFTFPMLDNGYVYLAATRMSLHRSDIDWAMVVEVFGFSPRAGLPDTHIYTFSSRLHGRKTAGDFVDAAAYEKYIANNPHNESSFVYPIEDGEWLDSGEGELIAIEPARVTVRGHQRPMPTAEDYTRAGVTLSEAPRVTVFELCRALAFSARDDVLATLAERGAHLLPGMQQMMVLDEWNHPDVVDDSSRPSNSETFRQLAEVLMTGDVREYKPALPPNTHWVNWPEGGTL